LKYLIVFFITSSCFSLAQYKSENNVYHLLIKLTGLWIVEPSEHPSFEYWELINEGHLEGYGFTVINQDTIILEKLKIINENSEYFYVAEVINQNDGNPVYFKLIQNDTILVFENKEHDFPNRILYDFLDNDLINVLVESSDKENPRKIKLILKRINEK